MFISQLQTHLGGGCNPFEKYACQIGNLLQISGWTFQKYLSCHHTSHGFPPFQPPTKNPHPKTNFHPPTGRLPHRHRRTGTRLLVLRTRQASHVGAQLVGGLRKAAGPPLEPIRYRNGMKYIYNPRKIIHILSYPINGGKCSMGLIGVEKTY